MDNPLGDLKRKVMELRYDREVGGLAVESQWKAVQKTNDYRMWEGSKADLQTIIQELEKAEEALRNAVIEQFAIDGNKTPALGIAVKLFDVLIYNVEEAAAWCKENAPYLFRFDAKAFEKAKPDGAPIEVKQEPRCQLASKLE